jgi:hypothetical protein
VRPHVKRFPCFKSCVSLALIVMCSPSRRAHRHTHHCRYRGVLRGDSTNAEAVASLAADHFYSDHPEAALPLYVTPDTTHTHTHTHTRTQTHAHTRTHTHTYHHHHHHHTIAPQSQVSSSSSGGRRISRVVQQPRAVVLLRTAIRRVPRVLRTCGAAGQRRRNSR